VEIHHPLASFALVLLLVASLYWAATWKAFVEPTRTTQRMFGLAPGTRVEARRLSVLARFGWFGFALLLAYALGRIQGWIL
jgi:hypothetical protein